jgi:uncharacterized membrane protein
MQCRIEKFTSNLTKNLEFNSAAGKCEAFFSKYLAPVGVLMAVLGYTVGTYGAYICGLILQAISGF